MKKNKINRIDRYLHFVNRQKKFNIHKSFQFLIEIDNQFILQISKKDFSSTNKLCKKRSFLKNVSRY